MTKEIIDKVLHRRNALKYYSTHNPCSKCGSYVNVIDDMTTGDNECEYCYIQRIQKEKWLNSLLHSF